MIKNNIDKSSIGNLRSFPYSINMLNSIDQFKKITCDKIEEFN